MPGLAFQLGRRACVPLVKIARIGSAKLKSTPNFHQVCLLTTNGPSLSNSEGAGHFRRSSVKHPLQEQLDLKQEQGGYMLPHPIWSREELEKIEITHLEPKTKVDKAAYYSVKTLRVLFDVFSGYKLGMITGTLDENKWLRRIIFLETVAGVPGMVAAMTRHLRSLRSMQRDFGWIHTLLEEAENERMHLMTAMTLKNPSWFFKTAVVCSQGIFVTMFSLAYLISPRFCHRFVGYLEEEAVKTYTHCLECFEEGSLKVWAQLPAPDIAKNYWRLPEGAMMRDVILVIRADEAHHRIVNHTLSSLPEDQFNPYKPGH
jgi:hypothetical protein